MPSLEEAEESEEEEERGADGPEKRTKMDGVDAKELGAVQGGSQSPGFRRQAQKQL